MDSWRLHSVTKKNFIATYESLEFSLCDADVVSPGRDATSMLEYFIGEMRTHQNADHLTIMAGHYVAQRLELFHQVCAKNGFKTGNDARKYSSAWEALDTKHHQPLRGHAGITSEEHLAIINECGAAVRLVLKKLGWCPSSLSAFTQDVRCMREVAAMTEAAFKKAKVPAEAEADEDSVVCPPQPQRMASCDKGKTPAASMVKQLLCSSPLQTS